MSLSKILTDLCERGHKTKLKNTFASIAYNALVVKRLWKFKNHFKQLAVPFKIYSDFESFLKWVKSNDKK